MKRTIDGVTFEVTPLGFKQARVAFVRLTKALGPALAHVDTDAPDMAAALSALVERVGDDDLEWFADVFGETTRFSTDGSKWPYLHADLRESLFSGGKLMLFFQWLAFALEVNFSDFLVFLTRASGGAAPSAEDKIPDSVA